MSKDDGDAVQIVLAVGAEERAVVVGADSGKLTVDRPFRPEIPAAEQAQADAIVAVGRIGSLRVVGAGQQHGAGACPALEKVQARDGKTGEVAIRIENAQVGF